MASLYFVILAFGIACVAVMKKICPEMIGAYIVYVSVILILLALVFGIENAW